MLLPLVGQLTQVLPDARVLSILEAVLLPTSEMSAQVNLCVSNIQGKYTLPVEKYILHIHPNRIFEEKKVITADDSNK